MTRIITACLVAILSGCSASFKTDKPVSRAEANGFSPYPLPLSASNVYYFSYAGGMQDLELYMRFDCDQSEIDIWVEQAITNNQKTYARSLSYTTIPIGGVSTQRAAPNTAAIPWWTPLSTTNGYYRGAIDSYALRIWVDRTDNRIHLYIND